MKIIVIGILLCVSAQLRGQDLIARPAPIDKKAEIVNVISPHDGKNGLDSIYIIGKTVVVDHYSGWEWLHNDESQYIEEYYPLELRYQRYDSHPQYKIVNNDVYDNSGKLVRITNIMESEDLDSRIIDALYRESYINDYQNNKYNFKKENLKAQNYVKIVLGLLSGDALVSWSDIGNNYLRQLNADHEKDFIYLLKCERMDNVSFKVTFGTWEKQSTSTWKVLFSSNGKYKWKFNVTKLPTEEFDWSQYDRVIIKDQSERKNGESNLHRVKRGETLQSIARKYHMSINSLCKINHIGKNVQLRPGQILKVYPTGESVGDEVTNAYNDIQENCQPATAETIQDNNDSGTNDSDIDSDIDPDKIYDVVEEMPMFPGGPSAIFDYLSKNIVYPTTAEENGVQGRVILSFVIDSDGSINDVKVQKSVDPSLDKEAIRIVESMPHWIPGKEKGKNVKVKYTIPVTFKLQ